MCTRLALIGSRHGYRVDHQMKPEQRFLVCPIVLLDAPPVPSPSPGRFKRTLGADGV